MTTDFSWKEAIPFVLSMYLLFSASAPLTRAPYDRYQVWIKRQLELLQSAVHLDDRSGDSGTMDGSGDDADSRRISPGSPLEHIDVESFVDRAKEAGSLSTLPAKVALTGVGYVVVFPGPIPAVATVVAVLIALYVQDRVDMSSTPFLGFTTATAIVLGLNVAGLVASILT